MMDRIAKALADENGGPGSWDRIVTEEAKEDAHRSRWGAVPRIAHDRASEQWRLRARNFLGLVPGSAGRPVQELIAMALAWWHEDDGTRTPLEHWDAVEDAQTIDQHFAARKYRILEARHLPDGRTEVLKRAPPPKDRAHWLKRAGH